MMKTFENEVFENRQLLIQYKKWRKQSAGDKNALKCCRKAATNIITRHFSA